MSDNGTAVLHFPLRAACDLPTWKDRLQNNPKLASALVKAQSKAEAILRDQKNPTFSRPHTTSEALISEGKDLLNAENLALLPIAFECLPETPLEECDRKTTFILRPVTLRRWFKLIHNSGEFELIGPYDWPTNPNKGTPTNLAFAATDTYSLAYVYRDVLGFPRLTAQEISAIEREEEKAILEANQNKQPVPAPKPAVQVTTTAAYASTAVVKSATEAPKPEQMKTVEQPKPVEQAKPVEQPKPTVEALKSEPIEQKIAMTGSTASTISAPSSASIIEGQKIINEMAAIMEDGAAKRPNAQAEPAPQQATPVTTQTPVTQTPVTQTPVTQTSTQTQPVAPPAAAGLSSTTAPTPSAQSTPPASAPASSSGTVASTNMDERTKSRQTSMLARLQALGARRLKENGGDATAFGAELNSAAGSSVMLEGVFKRSGLTDDSMKRLEPMLAKAGV